MEDVRRLLLAGADKCSINSAAVAEPELVTRAAEAFGSQAIVVAVDARRVADGHWEVFTHGGRKGTGIDAVGWAERMAAAGAGELLVTSMDRDGTKSGFDLDLLAGDPGPGEPAAGRLGRSRHGRAFRRGCPGRGQRPAAASVFHYGEFRIADAKAALAAAGLPVRPLAEAA